MKSKQTQINLEIPFTIMNDEFNNYTREPQFVLLFSSALTRINDGKNNDGKKMEYNQILANVNISSEFDNKFKIFMDEWNSWTKR